jgi:putative exosortase-associated protein (TIGR04073 family)
MELQMKKIFKSLLVISALAFLSPQAAMAHSEDYATHVADKLGHGIANTATGWAELPKTILVTSQKEGIVYGATAGVLTGLVHVVGRTAFGILDVATFVIPTDSTVKPGYIWEDFGKETSYGK